MRIAIPQCTMWAHSQKEALYRIISEDARAHRAHADIVVWPLAASWALEPGAPAALASHDQDVEPAIPAGSAADAATPTTHTSHSTLEILHILARTLHCPTSISMKLIDSPCARYMSFFIYNKHVYAGNAFVYGGRTWRVVYSRENLERIQKPAVQDATQKQRASAALCDIVILRDAHPILLEQFCNDASDMLHMLPHAVESMVASNPHIPSSVSTLVYAQAPGFDTDHCYMGGSFVALPQAQVVARASAQDDELLLADIDVPAIVSAPASDPNPGVLLPTTNNDLELSLVAEAYRTAAREHAQTLEEEKLRAPVLVNHCADVPHSLRAVYALVWKCLTYAVVDYMKRSAHADAACYVDGTLATNLLCVLLCDALGSEHVHVYLPPSPMCTGKPGISKLMKQTGVHVHTSDITLPEYVSNAPKAQLALAKLPMVHADVAQWSANNGYALFSSLTKLSCLTRRMSDLVTAALCLPFGDLYFCDILRLAAARNDMSPVLPSCVYSKIERTQLADEYQQIQLAGPKVLDNALNWALFMMHPRYRRAMLHKQPRINRNPSPERSIMCEYLANAAGTRRAQFPVVQLSVVPLRDVLTCTHKPYAHRSVMEHYVDSSCADIDTQLADGLRADGTDAATTSTHAATNDSIAELAQAFGIKNVDEFSQLLHMVNGDDDNDTTSDTTNGANNPNKRGGDDVPSDDTGDIDDDYDDYDDDELTDEQYDAYYNDSYYADGTDPDDDEDEENEARAQAMRRFSDFLFSSDDKDDSDDADEQTSDRDSDSDDDEGHITGVMYINGASNPEDIAKQLHDVFSRIKKSARDHNGDVHHIEASAELTDMDGEPIDVSKLPPEIRNKIEAIEHALTEMGAEISHSHAHKDEDDELDELDDLDDLDADDEAKVPNVQDTIQRARNAAGAGSLDEFLQNLDEDDLDAQLYRPAGRVDADGVVHAPTPDEMIVHLMSSIEVAAHGNPDSGFYIMDALLNSIESKEQVTAADKRRAKEHLVFLLGYIVDCMHTRAYLEKLDQRDAKAKARADAQNDKAHGTHTSASKGFNDAALDAVIASTQGVVNAEHHNASNNPFSIN